MIFFWTCAKLLNRKRFVEDENCTGTLKTFCLTPEYNVIMLAATYIEISVRLDDTRGGVQIYFAVRRRAAENAIIFKIPTPGQGIIFVVSLNDRVHILP